LPFTPNPADHFIPHYLQGIAAVEYRDRHRTRFIFGYTHYQSGNHPPDYFEVALLPERMRLLALQQNAQVGYHGFAHHPGWDQIVADRDAPTSRYKLFRSEITHRH
jgi:hypothetical protein